MAKKSVPVSKKALEQAQNLPAPDYVPGEDIPFKVGRVMPKTVRTPETYSTPKGKVKTDYNEHAAINRVMITLRKSVLDDNNRVASIPKVYSLGPLPFRTDDPQRCEALRDGHTSEDILRVLFMDPSYGIDYTILPVTDEEIKREAAQRRESRQQQSQMMQAPSDAAMREVDPPATQNLPPLTNLEIDSDEEIEEIQMAG